MSILSIKPVSICIVLDSQYIHNAIGKLEYLVSQDMFAKKKLPVIFIAQNRVSKSSHP